MKPSTLKPSEFFPFSCPAALGMALLALPTAAHRHLWECASESEAPVTMCKRAENGAGLSVTLAPGLAGWQQRVAQLRCGHGGMGGL